VIISSATAILIDYKGSGFDPIAEIQKLRIENRRDDALDLARFYRENQTYNLQKFAEIEKDLKYTKTEKSISFAWNGYIKGEVFDTPSGMGAVTADLWIFGDIRDLCIQFWKCLTDAENTDGFVAFLSAAGVGFSTMPILDGTAALSKNAIKYLKKIPAAMNKGLLKKFLSGNVSAENGKKIWQLFKKTTGPCLAPYPALAIFQV
jgi:hypothetical protein